MVNHCCQCSGRRRRRRIQSIVERDYEIKPRVVTLGRSLYRFNNRYANDYVVRDETVFASRLNELGGPSLGVKFSHRERYLEGINVWLDKTKAVSASIDSGASLMQAINDFYLPWNARVWSRYFITPPPPNQEDIKALQTYRQQIYEDKTNEDIDRTNEFLLMQGGARRKEEEKGLFPPPPPPSPPPPSSPSPPLSPIARKSSSSSSFVIRDQIITTPTEFWSAIGFSPHSATRARQVSETCRGVFGTKDITSFIQKYNKIYPGTILRAISLYNNNEEEKKGAPSRALAFALLVSRWMAANTQHFIPADGEEKWLQRRVVDTKTNKNLDISLTLSLDQPNTNPVWELAYACASPVPKGIGRQLLQWIVSTYGRKTPKVPLVLEVAEGDDQIGLVRYYESLGFQGIKIQALFEEGQGFKTWHTKIPGYRERVAPVLMKYQA